MPFTILRDIIIGRTSASTNQKKSDIKWSKNNMIYAYNI